MLVCQLSYVLPLLPPGRIIYETPAGFSIFQETLEFKAVEPAANNHLALSPTSDALFVFF